MTYKEQLNQKIYEEAQEQYKKYAQMPRYQSKRAQDFIKQAMKHNDEVMATGIGYCQKGMIASV